MRPRVLHLSTYSEGGGAARAANGVHLALQSIGVDSRLVRAHGPRFAATRQADRMLWRLQRSSVKTWRSPARFGSLSAREINLSSADIVNLHWVTDGFLSIEEIGKIEKPLVMSLYDMWAFCGTEHYGVDSHEARWRIGYTKENRPANERGWDINRDAWERKRDLWSSFHIIPPSRWLAAAATQSRLFESWPITQIPHPVNPVTFDQLNKGYAKTALGLDPARPVIGFLASAGIGDQRKGFDLLVQALKELPMSRANVQVLVVGPKPTPRETPLGVDIQAIGPANGDHALKTVYCAVDVLAVPSREDNMPLTAMEAQMCGTPVVAFAIGGLPDIVDSSAIGHLASPFDTQDFANGIQQVLDSSSSSDALGRQTRRRANSIWGFDVVAQQYLEVYKQVLDR